MKKILIFTASFFVFAFTSCLKEALSVFPEASPCSTEVRVGESKISGKSLAMVESLKIGQKLIFKNAQGVEISFIFEEENEEFVKLDVGTRCEYFESNNINHRFKTQAPFIGTLDYRWFAGSVWEYESESRPYDNFDINFSLFYANEILNGGGRFLADAKNVKPGTLNMTYFSVGDFSKTVILQGKTFQNVEFLKDVNAVAEKGVYFQKGFGVIGFQMDANTIWVFDRLE